MKKFIAYLIIATALFLSCFAAFSQDRTIDLALFAAKKEKSDNNITISDNSIDFKNITHSGYWLKFVGSYTRPISFKNNKGNVKISFENVSIKTNTSSQTLKFVDCGIVELDGMNNSKILGSGNNSGQLIDFSGKWSDVKIHGFYLDQMRNGVKGSTTGGAMVQLHGSESSQNHGDIKIWDLDGHNANDEFLYVLLYYSANASRAKSLEVWHTKIKNCGRDYWQATNIDSVYFHDNEGDNGNLEQEPNHISGFSLNDGNKYVRLERNRVTNIPQFIYSGTVSGKLVTVNNTYIQGTSGFIANQAIYTKSSTLMQGDSIIAPKVLIAAIAQDKAQVTYMGLTVVAPKLFRYTTPKPIELPFIKSTPVQAIVEETTVNGVTTKVLVYNGMRFIL